MSDFRDNKGVPHWTESGRDAANRQYVSEERESRREQERLLEQQTRNLERVAEYQRDQAWEQQKQRQIEQERLDHQREHLEKKAIAAKKHREFQRRFAYLTEADPLDRQQRLLQWFWSEFQRDEDGDFTDADLNEFLFEREGSPTFFFCGPAARLFNEAKASYGGELALIYETLKKAIQIESESKPFRNTIERLESEVTQMTAQRQLAGQKLSGEQRLAATMSSLKSTITTFTIASWICLLIGAFGAFAAAAIVSDIDRQRDRAGAVSAAVSVSCFTLGMWCLAFLSSGAAKKRRKTLPDFDPKKNAETVKALLLDIQLIEQVQVKTNLEIGAARVTYRSILDQKQKPNWLYLQLLVAKLTRTIWKTEGPRIQAMWGVASNSAWNGDPCEEDDGGVDPDIDEYLKKKNNLLKQRLLASLEQKWAAFQHQFPVKLQAVNLSDEEFQTAVKEFVSGFDYQQLVESSQPVAWDFQWSEFTKSGGCVFEPVRFTVDEGQWYSAYKAVELVLSSDRRWEERAVVEARINFAFDLDPYLEVLRWVKYGSGPSDGTLKRSSPPPMPPRLPVK